MRTHAMYTLLLVIIAVGMIPVDTALPRTWHVPSEIPTIPAAMDSASASDTVLVAPGTHYLQAMLVMDGVVLTSSHGASVTSIAPDPTSWPTPECGLLCIDLFNYTEISGFYIYGYRPTGFIDDTNTSIYINHCSNLVIKRNVIEASNWAIHVCGNDFNVVTLTNNTLYGNNIVFENRSLHITLDIQNNIFRGRMIIVRGTVTKGCNYVGDPLFCGNWATNYMYMGKARDIRIFYLHNNSPCAPGNYHPDGACGLIGALPVGCTSSYSEEWDWYKD